MFKLDLSDWFHFKKNVYFTWMGDNHLLVEAKH